MSFTRWLRSLRSAGLSRSIGRSRPAPRFRPRLEALEDRTVPAQIGLTVRSLADSGAGTLRAAILTADAGSHSDKFTIDFAVTGAIDLQSPLPDLNNSIAIKGPGAARLTVERSAGASFASAIVTVDAGQTASLSKLTIANGNAGGIANAGTLTLANSAVLNNSADPEHDAGGGISNQGTMTVSACTLSGNSSANVGGGIYNDFSGRMTVSGCTLSGNSAHGGGGISNDGTMTVSGSTFSGNSAAFGGGIANGGTLTISGSTLSGNSASDGGGIDNGGDNLTVSDCTLSGNSAFEGGGIFNGTVMTLKDSTLSGNSATEGGGIYNLFSGTLAVRDSLLTGNSATKGGGIYNNESAALTVSDSLLTRNSATEEGGGIYNDAFATVTVRDSLLTGNSATYGGGIYNSTVVIAGINYPGTLTVSDSTFTSNTASDSGGAIYNIGTATVREHPVRQFSRVQGRRHLQRRFRDADAPRQRRAPQQSPAWPRPLQRRRGVRLRQQHRRPLRRLTSSPRLCGGPADCWPASLTQPPSETGYYDNAWLHAHLPGTAES